MTTPSSESDDPIPSDDHVRHRMETQRTKNTAPEVDLRKALHARGLRFRLQRQVLQGLRRRHDIIFPCEMVAIDVHGCFWHGCALHYIAPKSNSEFWAEKVAANRRRDAETAQALAKIGWVHIVVWEHERPIQAAQLIEDQVRARR